MLERGEIEDKDLNRLYVNTFKSKIKIVFDIEENIHVTEFNRFNKGDRIIIHSIDTHDNLTTNRKESGITLIEIKFNRNIKITKDPFKYISDLRKDKYNDIIAACTRSKSLIQTKGTDYVFSLDLIDFSGAIELKVFTTQEEFQSFIDDTTSKEPFSSGDILLIRNVKMSNRDSVALIYKPCLISKIKNSDDLSDPSIFVQRAIAKILNEKFRQNFISKNIISKKNLQIKDLKDHCFFNILGKVLSCDYDINPSIKITDFTSNPNISDSSSNFPNSMILVIKLFGQHSYLVDRITVGGYFYFSNIRCKSFSPFIVAFMHDSLEGDIISVSSEDLLKDIKESETVYDEMKSKGNYHSCEIQNSSLLLDIEMNSTLPNIENELLETSKSVENESNELLETSKPIENTELENKSLECEISNYLPTLKIKNIKLPGVYLSYCFLTEIWHSPDLSNLYSILKVKEEEKDYRFKTKKNLTKKMLLNDKITIGKMFKCLVLLVGTGEFFMIDIFYDDQDFKNFVSFYKSTIESK